MATATPPTPDSVSLGRLRLIRAGHLKPDPRLGFPHHRHPFHELVICFAGIYHVRIGEHEIHARAGDVLFYPAQVYHEERSDPQRPADIRGLAFALEVPLDRAPVHARDHAGRLRVLIRWLLEEQYREPIRSALICRELTRTLLVEWLRVGVLRDPQIQQRLRRQVERDLTGSHTLDTLAADAGMSKYHYLRTYKHAVGRTPIDDVRAIRLEEAQRLLLTTRLSTKEIAARCGFCDQYHMGRLFRRLLDVTPGELRATRRLGDPEPMVPLIYRPAMRHSSVMA